MRNSTRRTAGASLSLAVLIAGLLGAARHITPTVVLRKQADVIRSTLPDARQFFLKTADVGREDLARIQRDGGFELEDPKVKFYLGKDGPDVVGVVLFPQVNTQHGPLEAGLTLSPEGTVQRVVVTKATVETKPWVQKAIATGFLDELEGARRGDDAVRALSRLRDSGPGRMPEFMGEVTLRAVRQGLVLHDVLYDAGAR